MLANILLNQFYNPEIAGKIQVMFYGLEMKLFWSLPYFEINLLASGGKTGTESIKMLP
jgi:hypothetical protein